MYLEELLMRRTNQATSFLSRRAVLSGAFATLGGAVLSPSRAQGAQQTSRAAPIALKDPLKVTKLETFLVKPRWLFLKVHTNAGKGAVGQRSEICAGPVEQCVLVPGAVAIFGLVEGAAGQM